MQNGAYHSFVCRIAELNIKIFCMYPFIARQCASYRISDDAIPDITVSASEEELIAEHRLLGKNFDFGYCESIVLCKKICALLPSLGAIMFHSSAVSVDGKGYAFFGRSGAGKSTHTRMLAELFSDRMTIINGDKPFYTSKNGIITVHGSPWCGKEGLGTNTKAQLSAICLIKRSQSNRIKKLSPEEAADKVIDQVIIPHDAENVIATFRFLDRLVKAVDVYELECDISADAARLSFGTMNGGKI